MVFRSRATQPFSGVVDLRFFFDTDLGYEPPNMARTGFDVEPLHRHLRLPKADAHGSAPDRDSGVSPVVGRRSC